jgi:hypothetical protein
MYFVILIGIFIFLDLHTTYYQNLKHDVESLMSLTEHY